MASTTARRSRWIAATFLAAGIALLGIELKGPLSNPSYDSLHSLNSILGGGFDDSRVVIIYLDLASYLHEHQDPGERWPREIHSRLVKQLTSESAREVVFDIVFDSPGSDSTVDRLLAESMHENGRVILAAEHNDKISHETGANQTRTRASMLRPIEECFAKAAAGWGVASLWVDDDFVVRRHLPSMGSEQVPNLSLAAARHLGIPKEADDKGLWVRYYGPALTIPHISYSEALDTNSLPPDFFRDKIVFVGARPIEGFMDARRDEFRSPFHSWNNKEFFMPGVEIHATQLLNLLRQDALHRLSNRAENCVLAAISALLAACLIWLRPAPATACAFAGMLLSLGAAVAGFSKGWWFPWLTVSAAQIPAALFGSWLWQFNEWFFTRRQFEAAKKLADAKIREQAALIDKAHDAILVQNFKGEIIYANPSAEKLYGWTSREMTREISAEIFMLCKTTVEEASRIVLKDGEWNGELLLQTRQGLSISVESRWTLIRDDSGNPKSLLLIGSDITEKKSLEQQFLRTQRMNTIGTLAGGMAHDLNNALSPVLLGAQLLRRKSSDEEDRKLLSLIETSANRGADMVRQVLLFARGRGAEIQRLEITPLVRELEKMVLETFPRNISIEAFLPSDLWPVKGNPTQLHQVLLNLCVNARDAMPGGGKLSFVADNVELDEAEAAKIPDATPGRYVSLVVSDTGTGMPPEVRARILEPFFTTKGEGKGTGIGLSTVIRILKSHGGFLRIESEVGQGTAFEVLLPSLVASAERVETPLETELARGNGELILVVNDELAMCELVSSEFRQFGYRTLTASNGAVAVSLFKQHPDEVKLIITDNSMLVMDGEQAITEIRSIRPNIPAVIMSGEPGSVKLKNVVELNKPFALAELLAVVSNCLK